MIRFLESGMQKTAIWAVKYAIPFILLGGFLSGCNSTKFLKQGEYLLDKNQVVIKQKMEDRGDLAYELSTFYRQRVNGNFFFLFPREYSYLNNSQPGDSTGWNRFKRETIGEPPTIYSDSLTTQTAQDMQTYLHYKGWLQAQVIPQRDPRKKKMRVSYYALPGKRYYIDSINYYSPDPKIDQLLQANKDIGPFSPGAPLDLSRFAEEKGRITSLMRNEGYAEFYQAQIGDLELDTFQTSNKANLYITVFPPYGEEEHQQFYIGDIDVYQDYTIDNSNIIGDTIIAGIRFFLSDRGFIVNPTTFRKAISLRPGERFSQVEYSRTNEQLAELGVFRYVRIKQERDPDYNDIIHLSIQLTPNYFFQVNTSLELNYTDRSNSINNNLIGMSLNPGAVHRNFLGGAELFTTNLSAGVEVAPELIGTDEFWNTVDLRADFDLTLPQFVDYLGLYRLLFYKLQGPKKSGLVGSNFYRTLRNQATTHIGAGYEYLLIFNWYSYDLLNISYGYDIPIDRYQRLSIDNFAINYLNPNTEMAFEEQLKENGFLERSFGQQVFFSLLLREIDYIRRTKTSLRGRTGYLNANFEIAGLELYGINRASNWLLNEQDTFRLGQGIDFSQYVKGEIDLRFQKQTGPEQVLAARLNMGAAVPFGFTSDVPYVKQFFVGGANSMRAWAPRGLGPGGYQDPLAFDATNNFRLFQTGDFKLEMNLEYRFPVFLRLKGALFLDVGNIWTLQPDDDNERPGSHLSLRTERLGTDQDPFYIYPFYKQMAIAGGMGFRLDLSYFIFRFDVGLKLRNNFPSFRNAIAPESAWWNDFRDVDSNDFGFNFGLGLPF
ncbi:MAG: BamA/TamA family outer membrane protein [Bacteroidota bacterium]